MNNIFYVYVYMDTRKPGIFVYGEFQFDFEPFYIGKGSKKQWLSHLVVAYSKTSYKSYRINIIRKLQRLGLEPEIVKYKENLSEKEAFDLEKKLIKEIGRIDLKNGPLTNLTDGGEGSSGCKCSKEKAARISKKLKGRTKENFSYLRRGGAKRKGRTKETHPGVARMAKKLTGRIKETHPGVARGAEKQRGKTKENDPGKARMAEKMKEKMKDNENTAKIWNLTFPDGTRKIIKNLKKFCRKTGLKKNKDFRAVRN